MKNSLPKTLFVILSALFLTFAVFGQEADQGAARGTERGWFWCQGGEADGFR